MSAKGVSKGPLGGALLIAGSCIGAGMLAFPIASGVAGFIPAMFAFILAWLFMTTAAFLLLEVNLRFGVDVSLITMTERTLGRFAKVVVWLTFLFLFYALNVAYITGSVGILKGVVQATTGANWSSSALSFLIVACGVWVLLFGYRFVVASNRWLMAVLVLSYAALIFLCAPLVKVQNLVHQNWGFAFFTLPIMMVSFGFQNLIPSLNEGYGGNAKLMQRVLWLGGFLTLFLYLIWQLTVLGTVPLNGPFGILDNIAHGREAASALIAITGRPIIGFFAWTFALSAILTSFLAQSLSLVDFLADGLGMDKGIRFERFMLSLMAVAPPLVVALIRPELFLQALSFAGGICAMILFGIIPALMCYQGRYHKEAKTPASSFRVPGGKPLLFAVITISSFVIIVEICREIMGIRL